MNILFCAYGDAGDIILNKMINNEKIKNIFCLTYNDLYNKKLIASLENNCINYSFSNIKDSKLFEKINNFELDIIISIYYRHLIPEKILNISKLGGVNLHPSLLPKYRGAFSCPWAIINGENTTGITYHYMNKKFDDGNIILQKSVKITKKETAFSLYNKLVKIGANNFNRMFNLVTEKKYKGISQVGKPSYYPRKVPYDGYIDRSWSNTKIERYIRAMIFPPKPFAKLKLNDQDYNINSISQYISLISE